MVPSSPHKQLVVGTFYSRKVVGDAPIIRHARTYSY